MSTRSVTLSQPTAEALSEISEVEVLGSSASLNWLALLLGIIVVITVAGNSLVCLAVHRERRLRNRFNYFLVSLALSDVLSAVLVMPLSIAKTFSGKIPMNASSKDFR